jgi:hypothetical protein
VEMHQYVARQRKTSELRGALSPSSLLSIVIVVSMLDVIYSVYLFILFTFRGSSHGLKPVDKEIVNDDKTSHIRYINTT